MTVLERRRVRPMAHTASETGTPDLAAVRLGVDTVLRDFLDRKEQEAPGPEFAALINGLRRLISGGKRLRSHLCVTGWHAAGGHSDASAVIRVAAALELFQTFALVHDDVMDASDIRRGQLSAHRALAAAYVTGGGQRGRAEAHGASAAVLLGDLALVWSDELLHTAGLEPEALARVLHVVDRMRGELVYGQYLDLLSTGRLVGDVTAALEVVRYKTAKYTVERPLHIGAAIVDATPDVVEACTAFAVPLGEAFQLRDDLLGVFGDAAETGKPVGDDLREGKATVLMALAVKRASGSDLRALHRLVGHPHLTEADLQRVRAVLEATGARSTVEEMIDIRREEALAALAQAPLPAAAARALGEIAQIATVRRA